MFAALGVKVTLVEAKTQFLPFLDHEIGQKLEQVMAGSLDIEILKGARWGAVRCTHPGVLCDLMDGPDGKVGTVLKCEKLLFAAGRVGATHGLGLDNIGLAADSRGALAVDEHYRTSVSNVYAAGDVIGFPALASTSMEQARVAVCHAFGIEYKKSVDALLPYGIYTIPEVSTVGETEESARAQKLDYVVGRAFFRDNARGLIQGDADGLIKLVVHRATRRLIGVHILGDRATELVHIGQAVMTLGGTVDALIQMVFNYPTLSESYKYAAYSALGALAKPTA
jgi:NAD(P) transhydrogenase